jgi:hypothetical protein
MSLRIEASKGEGAGRWAGGTIIACWLAGVSIIGSGSGE